MQSLQTYFNIHCLEFEQSQIIIIFQSYFNVLFFEFEQSQMYYLLTNYQSDSEGCLPRNGDSDLCGNGFSPVVAQHFNRSDWIYVQSHGASGTPPNSTNGPSSLFPWAGQASSFVTHVSHVCFVLL